MRDDGENKYRIRGQQGEIIKVLPIEDSLEKRAWLRLEVPANRNSLDGEPRSVSLAMLGVTAAAELRNALQAFIDSEE